MKGDERQWDLKKGNGGEVVRMKREPSKGDSQPSLGIEQGWMMETAPKRRGARRWEGSWSRNKGK